MKKRVSVAREGAGSQIVRGERGEHRGYAGFSQRPAEGEAENPKSQKQGFLVISFSREGLYYSGEV